MIFKGTKANWLGSRRSHGGAGYEGTFKGEWIPGGLLNEGTPGSFTIEMPAHSRIRTHFHRNNQFQVFYEGCGSLGPHLLDSLTVHYAGAYTGYGPLTAGEHGLKYLTLRPRYEEGAQYIPEHRDQMMRGPKRQATSRAINLDAQRSSHCEADLQMTDLFPAEPEPLIARLIRLPASESMRGPDPSAGGGQFYVVLSGTLIYRNETLERLEQLFFSPMEPAPMISAGETGLEALLLQFPPLAVEYAQPDGGDHAVDSYFEPDQNLGA